MGGDGFGDAALAAFGAKELEFISDGGFAVEVVEVDVEIIGDGFGGFPCRGAGALFVVADGGALMRAGRRGPAGKGRARCAGFLRCGRGLSHGGGLLWGWIFCSIMIV